MSGRSARRARPRSSSGPTPGPWARGRAPRGNRGPLAEAPARRGRSVGPSLWPGAAGSTRPGAAAPGRAAVGGGILRQHGGPGRGPSAARPPRSGEAGASCRGVRLRVTVSAPRGLPHASAPAGGYPTCPAPEAGAGGSRGIAATPPVRVASSLLPRFPGRGDSSPRWYSRAFRAPLRHRQGLTLATHRSDLSHKLRHPPQ